MAKVRVVALPGLLFSLGIGVLATFVAPDDGVDPSSLQQGIAIAVVMAAVPVAVIARQVPASRVISLGGAMTIAGMATTFGGNLAGLVMAIGGLPILVAGASAEPPMSPGLIARLLGYACSLVAGMWLSLGSSTPLMKTLGVLLAGAVATSSFWDPPKPERLPPVPQQ
jgi:hypothetical protein